MRKKQSLSQMRRNVKRMEDFMKRNLGYFKSYKQEVQTFKCDQCQNNFTTETDMKKHMEIHMEKEPVEILERTI